jgi:hypothetical protein
MGTIFSKLFSVKSRSTAPARRPKRRAYTRRQLRVEALEERYVPAITSMTQLAQLFSAHAGPTIVYLNFDGGTDNYGGGNGTTTKSTISPFVPLAGDSREADIAAIMNGVAKVFAPFNVEVERINGAGNYDNASFSYGNTTVFIGPDPQDSNAFTPGQFVDTPGPTLGYNHKPHSNDYNLAFVGDPTQTDVSGNQFSTWATGNTKATDIQTFVSKIAHEVGHTFGLEHVYTGNGSGTFSNSNPPDIMAYDAPNTSFLDQTFTVTNANSTVPLGPAAWAWWSDTGGLLSQITQQDSYTYLLAVLGPNMNQLAVTKNWLGGLESFAIGPNHDLIHQSQYATGGAWSGWQSLGGYVESFTVGTNANGYLTVFAIGGNNHLYMTQQVYELQTGYGQALWTDWADYGNYVRQVAVSSNQDGRLEVFAVGNDYGLWHMSQLTPNGEWGAWSELGWPNESQDQYDLGGVKQIAVQRNADGRLEVFAVGFSDNGLWHTAQLDPNGGTGWSTWSSLGDASTYVRQISVGKNADGRLEVFAIGHDYDLWHMSQVLAGGPTGWSAWSSLGGYVTSMAVNADPNGSLDVFAIGGDTALWHNTEINGGGWGTWMSLGGQVHDFAVADDNYQNNNNLLVLGIGVDGRSQDADLFTDYFSGAYGLPSGWKDTSQQAL